jgi:hypothetical protein
MDAEHSGRFWNIFWASEWVRFAPARVGAERRTGWGTGGVQVLFWQVASFCRMGFAGGDGALWRAAARWGWGAGYSELRWESRLAETVHLHADSCIGRRSQ